MQLSPPLAMRLNDSRRTKDAGQFRSGSIPLKNAVIPASFSKDLRGTKWADDALAWLNCAGNDLQQANLTFLISSGFGSGRGFFVTSKNLWQAAVVFSVRRLIKKTWVNDRDQFLQPNRDLPTEFLNDCLIWMLFNGSNLTASADGLEWNDKTWSIVNHFIPYTEDEVNASERFESNFMADYLSDKKLSPEAKAVLDAGRELWKAYFSQTSPYNIREEYKLNRSDVGWYQVRNALKARNNGDNAIEVDFSSFEDSYAILSKKLHPLVFEYGFLRD